jgi:hypothetical protein
MANYLRNPIQGCSYLVASQCDKAVFEALNGMDVTLWHCGDDQSDPAKFGFNTILLGGGCTVGTRSIAIAKILGFYNLHLFGLDTCLQRIETQGSIEFKHHAYPFTTPEEYETCIGKIQPITLGKSDKVYYLAEYHLGQLFDFKQLLKLHPDLRMTVHGNSVLAEFSRESNRDLAA